MAVSKQRTEWAMLLLRLAVGAYAFLQGFHTLRGLRMPGSLGQVLPLLVGLGQMLAGGLVILGLWMTPAILGLTALVAVPLVSGAFHGAPILGRTQTLLHLLTLMASGLGGAGKAALGKG